MESNKLPSVPSPQEETLNHQIAALHQLVTYIQDMSRQAFPLKEDEHRNPSLPDEAAHFHQQSLVLEAERHVRETMQAVCGQGSRESLLSQSWRLTTRAQITRTIDAIEEVLFQLEVQKLVIEESAGQNEQQTGSLAALPEASLFESVMARELSRCQRFGYTCTVAVFALTPWTTVHAQGLGLVNRVRGMFLCACKASVRSYDQIGWLIENEGAILLPQSDRWDAEAVCRRIAHRFHLAVRQGAGAVDVTAQVGVVTFPFDGEDPRTLFEVARARCTSSQPLPEGGGMGYSPIPGHSDYRPDAGR